MVDAIYILDLVGGWVVYGYIVTHNSYYSDAASEWIFNIRIPRKKCWGFSILQRKEYKLV